jgi:quinoprotein glucose dehydrogenase
MCSGCHGKEREGGMGMPLFTAPGRLSDAQITSAVRRGRGSMSAVPVPEAKLQPLVDFLLERDRPANTVLGEERKKFRFVGYSKLLDQDERPGIKPPWGTLNAINLNTGKIAWRVPLGEYEDLTAGGLVFAGGTRDQKLRAFDSGTGKELWEYKLPFGGNAPPAVYEVNGRQYLVIAATGGGKIGGQLGDAWVAFTLDN